MRYVIELEYLYRKAVEVEASCPEEAALKASSLPEEEIFGGESAIPVSSLEDPQPVSCYDEDGNTHEIM